MTLNSIRIHFFQGNRMFNNMPQPQQVTILVRALDYLSLVARQDAAIYHGEDDIAKLTQKQIYEYLCLIREYDASEISRIIRTFKEEFNDE